MIFTLNSFWRGFSPLSNLNIKLSSFAVLERKEGKEIHNVYQIQQRSTDLCRDFYVHPTQLFILWWILIMILFWIF
jgi:hypothetical protein